MFLFFVPAQKKLVPNVTSKFLKEGKVKAATIDFLWIFMQSQKQRVHFFVIFIILK